MIKIVYCDNCRKILLWGNKRGDLYIFSKNGELKKGKEYWMNPTWCVICKSCYAFRSVLDGSIASLKGNMQGDEGKEPEILETEIDEEDSWILGDINWRSRKIPREVWVKIESKKLMYKLKGGDT